MTETTLCSWQSFLSNLAHKNQFADPKNSYAPFSHAHFLQVKPYITPSPHLKKNIMSFLNLSFCRLRWTFPVKSKDAYFKTYFENAAQTNFREHSASLLSVMHICKQTIQGSYPEYGGGGASCWPLRVRASLYEGRPGATILDKGTDSGIGCPSTPIRTGTLWRCRIH